MTINGSIFQMNEEFIVMAMGLDIIGQKWQKVTKVADEASMTSFFKGNEARDCYCSGFKRDKLLEP